jgi:hypothetical protein
MTMSNDGEQFYVEGPCEVPCDRLPQGKMVSEDQADFWHKHRGLAGKRGCYNFCMKAGRGITPIYVGKTKKNFEQEVFALHKVGGHYQRALLSYRRGTPVLFFLALPSKQGKPNSKIIGELEKYLIATASLVNPDLSNRTHNKAPKWGIKGVLRSTPGKIGIETQIFRKMMRMD